MTNLAFFMAFCSLVSIILGTLIDAFRGQHEEARNLYLASVAWAILALFFQGMA